jgi:Cyclin D1 binding domain
MYGVHAPYWFLLQHRLWFADRLTGHQELIGQLALARYDDRMGVVELMRLQAHLPSQRILMRWSYDPRVVIFSFNPSVSLQVDDPVLRLEPGQYGSGPRLKKEIDMPAMSERFRRGMRCRLMLTRAIPTRARVPENGLWPPSIVPHVARVRCQSPSNFLDDAHKPDRQDEVCETAFRTRMWSHFHGMNGAFGIRIGEEIATWSTLPEDAYTATAEKPFQGIWVGDYALHGPEFILITQKTPAEVDAHPPAKIEEMSDAVRDSIGIARQDRRALIPWSAAMAAAAGTAMQITVPPYTPAHASADSTAANTATSTAAHGEASYTAPLTGRLEAIKLTGDPNVPRGQFTFVAEDVGPAGLIRIADETPFTGARVVRSWGHVATRGFSVDGWMEGQLILKSPNRVAQYWIETGHVVWYRRVNWAALLNGDDAGAVVRDEGEEEEESD